jgi:hypothetical protein
VKQSFIEAGLIWRRSIIVLYYIPKIHFVNGAIVQNLTFKNLIAKKLCIKRLFDYDGIPNFLDTDWIGKFNLTFHPVRKQFYSGRILKKALELVIGKSYSAVKFDVDPVVVLGLIDIVWVGALRFDKESNRSI